MKKLLLSAVFATLWCSPCFAAAQDPYDGYPSDTFASCGKVTESGERIIAPGEGCTYIVRAYKRYQNKLRYWMVFRPIGSSTWRKISRTKTYQNRSHWGFETLRFPSQGTGTYCLLFDDNGNGYPDAFRGDVTIYEVAK